jgi:hypothetical protein
MHSALDRVSEFLDIDINSELSDIHSNKSGVSKSKSLNNLILKENVLRKFVKKIIPYNIRQVIKNKIRNFNKEDINYTPLNLDLKSELFDMYFKEDVSNLENLLNKKMDWN